MPFPAEMDPFQAEVSSNQCLVAGGNAQNGTIIPDTRDDVTTLTGFPADARNQRFFTQRQATHYS
jgi:hypothetical protein